MKKQHSHLKASGVRKPAPRKEYQNAVVSKKGASPKKSGKKAASEKSTIPQQTAEDHASRQNPDIKPFPIVGIGASAGGIEAFSRLLEHLSPHLGMAYVYVQHLSPKHESFLPEILQRKTKMPVITVKDGTQLEKDKVYVMPAKFSMTVMDGRLKLERQDKAGGSLHSIDQFLSSLALLYQQTAVGIILSGTGSDGTAGLMAIKAHGGITFAQDDSAHSMGMPGHAVDAGCVDFVMPPDKIAKELAALIQHPYSVTSPNEYLQDSKPELRRIHLLLHSKRGVDFSYYKQTTIQRRVLRRMAVNRTKDMVAYADLLKVNRDEVDALYQDLLITVTNFFRDPAMYEALTNLILPSILKNRKPTDPIRIWIPGCATGEEAVSFAIVLLEYLGVKAEASQIQIFATDLNEKAIEKARAGIYWKAALQNVSQQRLNKFFFKTNGQYQVVKAIRDMCIFASHNLLKDPPFSKMDIISCQNVLIYLESAAQQKIMRAFHYSLKPDGYLLLGKSETIGTSTDLFDPISKQYKAYTKRMVKSPLQYDFSVRTHRNPVDIREEDERQVFHHIKEPDLEKETDRLLLSKYVPASVLVNRDMEILRFRGATSRYIEPASGKASLHLLKMIRQELSFDLRTVLHRARKEGVPARKEGIIMNSNGETQEISIEAMPINSSGKGEFYLIIFKDESNHIPSEEKTTKRTGKPGKSQNTLKQVSSLQAQLKEARENIKILTEDFDATREELQTANEEVLTSNEELQSINEELETSREKLQSTNEELTTVNEELLTRNAELKEAGDYTRAIAETINESLLMLTGDLKIKSANKRFYQQFQVTPEETEGFFLYDLGNQQWDIPALRKQIRMVQTRDIPLLNFEVDHHFPSIGRKNMLLNAHKFPLKEDGESIIMLSIQDLTDRKIMEESLKEKEERFRILIQNASDIITIFDQDLTIKYESPATEVILGYKVEERVGRNINMDPIVHPEDRKTIIRLLRTSLAHPGENIYGEFRLCHKDGKYRVFDVIFRNLLDDTKINGIIANYRDITEKKSLEHQKDEFMGVVSHELKTPVTSIKAYAQILEEGFRDARDKKSADLLSKMNKQIDRLSILIVDLLDFTRIEGGSLKFREEKFSTNELINEVTEEMQRTTTQHVIEKKLDNDVTITGDRYRTGQVLTNLLSNAIKYSPKSKKIIVRSEQKDKNIIISVQDFGIGIEQKLLKKVFDRFFRITQTSLNTYPGLGLGLYVAAKFIERQGGEIWVKSTINKGSTFFFSLPLN